MGEGRGGSKEEGERNGDIRSSVEFFLGKKRGKKKNIRYVIRERKLKLKKARANARRSSCVFSPAHEKTA